MSASPQQTNAQIFAKKNVWRYFVVVAKMEWTMQNHIVSNAFNDLPLSDKVILSLVHIEGLSYEEAAVALRIDVSVAQSKLNRAFRRLNNLIETYHTENVGSAIVQ